MHLFLLQVSPVHVFLTKYCSLYILDIVEVKVSFNFAY